MRTRGNAKEFRERERDSRAAADASGKVAAGLETPEHTEDELQQALGLFMIRLLEMNQATR